MEDPRSRYRLPRLPYHHLRRQANPGHQVALPVANSAMSQSEAPTQRTMAPRRIHAEPVRLLHAPQLADDGLGGLAALGALG